MAQTAVVFTCLEDIDDFFSKKELNKEDFVFYSTHGSVVDELEFRNIHCQELVATLDMDFLDQSYEEAEEVVEELLTEMNIQFAERILKTIDCGKLNLFKSIYGYLMRIDYMVLLRLEKAFQLIATEDQVQNWVIYQTVPQSYLRIHPNLFEQALTSALNLPSKFMSFKNSVKKDSLSSKINYVFKRLKYEPFYFIQKFFEEKHKAQWSPHAEDKKNVFVFEPKYDLKFILDDSNYRKSFQFCVWPQAGDKISKLADTSLPENLHERVRNMSSDQISRPLNYLQRQFVSNMITDFKTSYQSYLKPLLHVSTCHRKKAFDLAVWDTPTSSWEKSLLNEFFMANGVPVIGAQHGGCYGYQDLGQVHFYNDFERCTTFLSYGFNEQDLVELYPDSRPLCEIEAVGSSRIKKSQLNKGEAIDVLFPLNNAHPLSVLSSNNRPDVVTQYQRALLTALNGLALNCAVSTLPIPNDQNTSVFRFLQGLKAIRIFKGDLFINILNNYQIGAVVIERPSTQLLEVVGRDMEIFILKDPVYPFSDKALAMLEKRAHCCDSTDQMIVLLEQWSKGSLKSKRDDEFFEHFAFKNGSKEKILQCFMRETGLCSS